METPARLVRRAALNKRQRAAVQPPPQPLQPPPQSSPRHTSSHASYTALMRSHDRVSTRHIPPGRGA